MIRSVFRAFDLFFFAYLFIVTFLALLYRDAIPAGNMIIAKNCIMFLIVCLFIRYGEYSHNAALRFCRFWYLCAGVPVLFTELKSVTHVVRPVDYDNLLIALDLFLFGVHPTVWLERFIHPLLTEILQILYVLYLFLPLPLGFVLYFTRREDDFYSYTTAVSMLFFLSFVGYMTVPAIGPQHTLARLQLVPLRGIWFADGLQVFIEHMDRMNRDCFPSGHAAMAALVCIESYTYHRRLFFLYLFWGTGVVLGTVYLRYHYAVDIPPGIILAFFCSAASRRLVPWWERKIHRKRDPLSLSPAHHT